MILHENLLQLFKISFRVQELVGITPYKISASNTFVESSRYKVRKDYYKTILLAIYNIIMTVQLFHNWKNEEMVINIEGLLFVFSFYTYWIEKCVVNQRRNMFCELMNLFIRFEERHEKGTNDVIAYLSYLSDLNAQ